MKIENGKLTEAVARNSCCAATGPQRHATVVRDGYRVPLIGVPVEAVLETCDCCGNTIGLSESEFTGTQVLCRKCNKPNP